MDDVNIEAWATFPSAINPYANLFAFGGTDTTPLDSNQGNGYNYVTFSPHTGAVFPTPCHRQTLGQGNPDPLQEWDAILAGVLDNQTNVHIVAVYRPSASVARAFYTNGVLAATYFNVQSTY